MRCAFGWLSAGVFYWALCFCSCNDNTIVNPPVLSASDSEKITFISPAGGEKWEATTVHYLRWTALKKRNLVLSYTIDRGITWAVSGDAAIKVDDSTWGNYPWEVPAQAADSCKIRLADYVTPQDNPGYSKVFTILPTTKHVIYVTAPASMAYLAGSTTPITWSVVNVSAVRLDYSTDGGTTYLPVVNDAVTNADSGWLNYNWVLPAVSSDNCRVRISENNGADTAYSPQFRIVSGN